ncbi:MAG TPA: LysR family transcriptional regulator [Rhodanobacteraceae bacterium]
MKSGFRHIRGFLQVAELGSFTQAAQNLHVSQPALTVQIHQLEEDLGVRLFDRDRRKVTLTPAGKRLLAPMQKVLDNFDEACKLAHELGDLSRGRLAIAALPSVAANWLPQRIARFHETYPNIEVRVIDVVSDQVQTLVAEASVDLGVGVWLRRDLAIQFKKLFEDRMHVFFPPDHELASVSSPNLKVISRYPHISMARTTSVRQLLDHALQETDLSVDVTCEVDRLSTAINMVRAGVGIAVLPLSTLDSISCEGLLHRPIEGHYLQRAIGVMTPRKRLLSPAAEAFSLALQDSETAD